MSNRSAAQATAARANGHHSRGPVTEEGRQIAAANSRKHGLCSKEFVLETDAEQARFAELLAELEFTHQAKNELEKEACHHLGVAIWRRRVCDNLEKELLIAIQAGRACALSGGDGLPGLNAINRYRARIARDIKEARSEITELKTLRVKAFEAQMQKAREFASLDLLGSLKRDLGEEGFAMFRSTVTNEPGSKLAAADATLNQTNPAPTQKAANPEADSVDAPDLNRRGRRYLEKLARKQKHRQT